MELTPKQRGNLTELQVISYFYSLGYQCSIPYGENSRYDLVADIHGHLIRIQVKTSSIKNGNPNAICFSCRSSRVNSKGVLNKRYTENEIDYFATMWDGQCYLVPIKECSAEKTLRFCVPHNAQLAGINLAKDYTVETQIEKLLYSEEVV